MKRFLAARALLAVFCLALLGGCAQKEPAGETVSSPSPPVSAEAGEALFRFDPEEVGAVEIHAHGRGAPWRADEGTKREIVERLLAFRYVSSEPVSPYDGGFVSIQLYGKDRNTVLAKVANLSAECLESEGNVYYPAADSGGLWEWGVLLVDKVLSADDGMASQRDRTNWPPEEASGLCGPASVPVEREKALVSFDPEEIDRVLVRAGKDGPVWQADEETKREIVERLLKFRFQTAEYLGDTDWALAELTLWREGEDEPVFTVENLGDDWLKADGILYYPTEDCGGLAEWGGSLAQRALEAREEAEP